MPFNDPIMIILLLLIVVMIIFTFRNGKKQRERMQKLNDSMRPGVEVMLNSGIFGTIVEIDDEHNRVTVASGSSTLVVHRQAVAQLVEDSPAPAAAVPADDDPEFAASTEKNEKLQEAPEFGERTIPASDAESEQSGDDTAADSAK